MDDSPKKRKIEVELGVRATGAGKAASDLEHVTKGLANGMFAFVASGSAAQGMITGIGAALHDKFIGPLGGAIGTIYGIIGGFRLMGQQLEQVARGVGVLSRMETFENSFKPLLKGAGAAKERIAELYRFAAVTPFRMGDIAGANRNLELLTRGGFSSERAMRLVGDAASVAGEDLGSVSLMVGRLYDNLKAGRPIGEYSYRLQEMGVFSSELSSKLELATDAGADFGTKWAIVESELGKSAGAMRDNSETLVGLKTTLEDTRDAFAASFSGKFLEAEKQSIRTTMALLEAGTPAAKEFAEVFAAIKIPFTSTIDAFVEKIAKLPSTATALKGAGLVAGIGTIAMIGAKLGEAGSGIARYSGLVRGLSGVKGLGADGKQAKFNAFDAIKSGGFDAVNALAAVTVKIAEFRGKSLENFGAFDFKKVDSWKAAWGNATTAIGLGLKSVKLAFKAFVIEPLAAIAALIAANPIMAAIGAIVGITAAWYFHMKGIREEMKGIADATAESRSELDRMIASASTMEEKTAAIAKAYQTLIAAQKALNQAKEEGKDSDIIAERQNAVNSAAEEVAKAKKIEESKLRGYQVEIEMVTRRARMERDANDATRDALIERATGEEKIALVKARADELERRAQVAEDAVVEGKKVADAQTAYQGEYDAATERENDAEKDADSKAARNEMPWLVKLGSTNINDGAGGDSGEKTGIQEAWAAAKEEEMRKARGAQTNAKAERIAAFVAKFGAAYATGTTDASKAAADIKLANIKIREKDETLDPKYMDKEGDSASAKAEKAAGRKAFERRKEEANAVFAAYGHRVKDVDQDNYNPWSKEQGKKIAEDPEQARRSAIDARKREQDTTREESIEARKRRAQSATDTASGSLSDVGEARAREEYAIRKAGQADLDKLEKEAAEARWKATEREAYARGEVITAEQLAAHDNETIALDEQQKARRAQSEQHQRDRQHRVRMARKDQQDRMEIEEGKAEVKFGRGSARAVQGMEDKKEVTDRAIELKKDLDISDEDAESRAMREKRAAMLNGAQLPSMVADSLQSIGGGGNYYSGGTDPQLAVATRMAALQEQTVAILADIRQGTNNGGTMN